MKFEINLVTQQHLVLGFPVRQAIPGLEPQDRIDALELTGRRRAVRVQTDALIDSGIKAGTPLGMAMELCACNTAVAGSCVQLGIEPDYTDFAEAAIELIEKTRSEFDRGLQLQDWQAARRGAAGLHLIIRAVAALLSIPYEQVFQVMHEGYMARQEPDKAKIIAMLRGAGYQIQDEQPQGGNPA